MYLKIIPIFSLFISTILSILSYKFLNIGKDGGSGVAPAFWLFYLIWSLSIAAIICFFLFRRIAKSWNKIVACIAQLALTLLLAIFLLCAIPNSFISFLPAINNQLMFRTISNTIKAPTVSVKVLEFDYEYPACMQHLTIKYWGFIGYASSRQWKNPEQYTGSPKNDPTTLEFALAQGDKADFMNKFLAILDSKAILRINRNIKPLCIAPKDISANIKKLLPPPPQKGYQVLDILIAFKELDLLDTVTGYNGIAQQYYAGGTNMSLEDKQLYYYYRLAKDQGKVRLIDDSNFRWRYGTDYFYWAILFNDADLAKDLVLKNSKPSPIYLYYVMRRINSLELTSDQIKSLTDILNIFMQAESFDNFKAKATGKDKLDSMDKQHVGYASDFNGLDISKGYNEQLTLLKKNFPNIYQIMLDNGYRTIE